MAKPPVKKFKPKVCAFCGKNAAAIDYKDIPTLRKFISDRGKIRARIHINSTIRRDDL
jgi:small subunit ribosomal protein S18